VVVVSNGSALNSKTVAGHVAKVLWYTGFLFIEQTFEQNHLLSEDPADTNSQCGKQFLLALLFPWRLKLKSEHF